MIKVLLWSGDGYMNLPLVHSFKNTQRSFS